MTSTSIDTAVFPRENGYTADVDLPGGRVVVSFTGSTTDRQVHVKSEYLRSAVTLPNGIRVQYGAYWLRSLPYRVEMLLQLGDDGQLDEPLALRYARTIQRLDRPEIAVGATSYRQLTEALYAAARAATTAMPDGFRLARVAYLEQRHRDISKEVERLRQEIAALVDDDDLIRAAHRLVELAPVGQIPAHACPEPRKTLR